MSRLTHTLFWVLIVGTLAMITAGPNRQAAAEGEEVVVEVEGDPMVDQLHAAFATIRPEHIPTGILLEAGAVYFDQHILQRDGRDNLEAGPTTPDLFRNMYHDLAQSDLYAGLPDLAEVTARAATWRQESGAIPLAVAVVDYDTLGEVAEADFVDGVYQPRLNSALGETRRFVASAPLVNTIYGPPATFVIPADLVVGNRLIGEERPLFTITFEGTEPQTVAVDQPFTVYELHPDAQSHVTYTLTFTLDGQAYTTRGGGEIVHPRNSGDCYDFDPVTATIPFSPPNPPAGFTNPLGAVDIRILPGPGSVSESSDLLNPDGCYDGGQPNLVCPLVVVPGFSFSGDGSFNDITANFGDVISMLQGVGYDVILLNYANGQDYIQRNGLAIRQFLVHTLPGWIMDGRDCAALVGISMGTQTARYAMRTAELAGEDHHIGLFVSLDGPYQGANIPTSIQATVNFLAPEVGDLQPLVDTLDSPAARQMLIKNRYQLPYWPYLSIYYQSTPEFLDYYAEADALGLPQDSRNVAVANGSGTGSLQNNGSMEKILYAELDGPLWTGMKIDARTDHNGQIFYGKITKLFSSRSLKITLSAAEQLDIAPGGFLDIHTDLIGMAQGIDDDLEIYSELEHFDFVPTSSALGANFDATFHHKCNTEHVVGMNDQAIAFIAGELVGYLFGFPPPPPLTYQTPCGQPEPGDPLPPHASCTATPDFGIGQVTSTLDASASSDPDGVIVSHAWDFDDGASASGPIVTHTFFNPYDITMFFDVTVTVTDDDGMTDIAYCPVQVECENDNDPWFCMH